VTYLSLVLRRVWARRLMLLGSLLGATLVTALLVVLPLYEASVAAVDLLFTFRQAPDATVDLTAVYSTTEYLPVDAVASRRAIADAAAPISAWYPTIEERTLSREFVVIPLADPEDTAGATEPVIDDWLGAAEVWRTSGAAEGGEPAPYPTRPPEATQVRIFTAPDVAGLIDLVEGELVADQDPAATSDPLLRIVIGEGLVRFTQFGVGDRFIIKGFTALPEEFEIVEVSGIARPADPEDSIWEGINTDFVVILDPATFDAWTTIFPLADPAADPWLRPERGLGGVASSQLFILHLDREAVALENVEDLTRGVASFTSTIARVGGIRTLTRLPAVIEEFDVRTVVLGAPILAMLALIVAGALYFLIYMASLALERESSELALLRMRGATPWQTTGLHLMQSGVIAIVAVLVAPFFARAVVSLTGRIPPMSTLTGGEALSVASGRSIVPFALAGGVLTFVSMGLAILPFSRRSILELRALSTRPARRSVWQRYHLDLFLVVLSAVILFELRTQGIVDPDASDLGLDPFSVAAPALFLFSGALLLLRLLPWILRGIGWIMTRFRGLTTALPGWHLGRNPIPYGRLALLVWLTTGFGAFAITYADTLDVSYADRAGFAAGADVRIGGEGAGFLTAPEGTIGSAVFRGTGAPRLTNRGAELIAVDPDTFPAVLAWRADFGAPTAADLFGPATLGGPPDWGVELPPGVTALRVDGVVVPDDWESRVTDGERPPIRMMARVVDEQLRLRIHAATASFTDGGWSTVEIPLDGASARNGPFPDATTLVLQALWVEQDVAGIALVNGDVLVDGWVAISPVGEQPLEEAITAEFTGHENLDVSEVAGSIAADGYYERVPEGETRPSPEDIAASPWYRAGTVTMWDHPERNRAQPVPHLRNDPQPMNFVLDEQAAAVAGLQVGHSTQFGVEGAQIPGTLTGIVTLVPTAGDSTLEGVMVARLDALLHWLNPEPSWSLSGPIARVAAPQELWIETDTPNETLREVLATFGAEPDLVLTTDAAAAEFSSRPIQVGLVSILFLGTGAGVVLTLAGVTGYVLVAVRRRYREMGVLRALGFRSRGVAGTFALEQLVVLGVGAVVGVAAGLGLMRLMIPFLQLGEEAEVLTPPAVMVVSPARLGLYLAVVAVLLVISVLWSTRAVSARKLSEVLREVER